MHGKLCKMAAAVGLAVSLLAVASSSWAHPGKSRSPRVLEARAAPIEGPTAGDPGPSRTVAEWRSAPPVLDLRLLLLAGVGLGLILARQRRLAAALLLVAVVGLGAETAVHSVHHLNNPEAAAKCTGWNVSQHVVGHSGPDAPRCPGPVRVPEDVTAEPGRGHPRSEAAWLALGRAPPAIPTV
jgi:hypothetical protein